MAAHTDDSIDSTQAGAPSTSCASHKAFNIAELLELMLLQLPPAALLKAKQVCKGRKAAIEDSKVVKNALFLEPTKSDSVWIWSPVKQFGQVVSTRPVGRKPMQDLAIGDLFLVEAQLNTLICKPVEQENITRSDAFSGRMLSFFVEKVVLRERVLTSINNNAHSIGDDTFITNPPVQHARLVADFKRKNRSGPFCWQLTSSVTNAKGLRLSDVRRRLWHYLSKDISLFGGAEVESAKLELRRVNVFEGPDNEASEKGYGVLLPRGSDHDDLRELVEGWKGLQEIESGQLE